MAGQQTGRKAPAKKAAGKVPAKKAAVKAGKAPAKKAAGKAQAKVNPVAEEAVASVGARTGKPGAKPEGEPAEAPPEIPWTYEDAKRLCRVDGYSAEQVKRITGHSV